MAQESITKTLDQQELRARMVRAAETLQELYDAMEGWSELVVQKSPVLVCQQGCARCCKHQVLVGEREWEIIHAWIRQSLTKAQRQAIVQRVRQQLEQAGNPLKRWLAMRSKLGRAFVRAVSRGFRTESTRCPMLGDDNRCGIYPVRPFVCRAYGRAELSDGRAMLCDVFTGRLRQQPDAREGMELQKMQVMSPKYFALNKSPNGEDGRFTIMSAHVLRHATGDDDIARQPIPLAAEKTYPVVTQQDFPESKG